MIPKPTSRGQQLHALDEAAHVWVLLSNPRLRRLIYLGADKILPQPSLKPRGVTAGRKKKPGFPSCHYDAQIQTPQNIHQTKAIKWQQLQWFKIPRNFTDSWRNCSVSVFRSPEELILPSFDDLLSSALYCSLGLAYWMASFVRWLEALKTSLEKKRKCCVLCIHGESKKIPINNRFWT